MYCALWWKSSRPPGALKLMINVSFYKNLLVVFNSITFSSSLVVFVVSSVGDVISCESEMNVNLEVFI